jgi:hypothetical protein
MSTLIALGLAYGAGFLALVLLIAREDARW